MGSSCGWWRSEAGIGGEIGGSLVESSTSIKIPLPWPYDYKNLVIGVTGNALGAGIELKYENGKITTGATAIIGGSITIGLE